MKLNVGCGRNLLEGWINLDKTGGDIKADLNERLPFEDNSATHILMSHVLEHIQNPLPMMEELYRIAKPGCLMVVACPYGSSDDAWEDPTHVRPIFASSTLFFSQPAYWKADYGYRGDWRTNEIHFKMRHAYTDQEILTFRNLVSEIVFQLEAIKPARAQDKSLLDSPRIFKVTP